MVSIWSATHPPIIAPTAAPTTAPIAVSGPGKILPTSPPRIAPPAANAISAATCVKALLRFGSASSSYSQSEKDQELCEPQTPRETTRLRLIHFLSVPFLTVLKAKWKSWD